MQRPDPGSPSGADSAQPSPRDGVKTGKLPGTILTNATVRMAMQRVAVLGKWLYIDGGEISRYINGSIWSPDDAGTPSSSLALTWSIDLSTSWTNETVTINKIAKDGIPLLNEQALWVDAASNAFYTWGGQTSYGAAPPPSSQVWKFFAGGSGGGSWALGAVANPRVFDALARSFQGAFASGGADDGDNTGFLVGGKASPQTDAAVTNIPRSDFAAFQPVPGVVSYNMTSGAWANGSAAGLSPLGTYVGGSATFVPGFGARGLVCLLGGAVTTTLNPTTERKHEYGYLGFDNVTFYDPAGGQWYSQRTSGDIPSPRELFCAVGAEGTNGTYEIFIFGGLNRDANATYGDVYLLSLPGFVWFHALSSPALQRARHTCVAAGGNSRQMLVVGGVRPSIGMPAMWTDPDPWRGGLGVFDMAALGWSGGYDADAAPYASPEVVREWYGNGSASSVQWSSDTVKNIFLRQENPTPNSPTSSSSPSPSSSTQPQPQSSRHIRAIIGGTIGGGIGLILIVLACVFWYQHRRDRSKPRWFVAHVVKLDPLRGRRETADNSGNSSGQEREQATAGGSESRPASVYQLHGDSQLHEFEGDCEPVHELEVP